MDALTTPLLFTMAMLAGIINSAIGSGSLLTLPVLLSLGVPPGVAVRTNTIGMTVTSIGSVLGYRKEIARELPHLTPITLFTILGATSGSILLLLSPSEALDFVIPILIVVALLMVIFQPRLARWANKDKTVQEHGPVGNAYRRPSIIAPMSLASVYGGYFTAAQGILYMAILGVGTGRSFKDVNPVKNYLSLFVNVTAAAVYIIAYFMGAQVLWGYVLVIAAGGLIGGFLGSSIAKRLPNGVFRLLIVVVALVALVRQLL
ncbi:sulfite exporter TauE/SafE family protein [Corynebacterium cystitidis]|uniref:Probable membrane transporter protein n=1 Tax=Corynebacterium cystitidis DSM 20524 TaxID=1121357 RepID=A0A1H9W0D5_9CORY|nr:sulfite exporter TauE/SafE family protein [Corynebacterium cystitidis]WJY81347.1 hypothetical protein CCYS_01870 [Corynebacterium cystitidis DSM 20524]SES27201.1 hypothetical protein SAMN05661109_02475 [Corynebacterium cystitidis DSM 20524]SNV88218.1 predicted permease [Corynebacterium cystitidis]